MPRVESSQALQQADLSWKNMYSSATGKADHAYYFGQTWPDEEHTKQCIPLKSSIHPQSGEDAWADDKAEYGEYEEWLQSQQQPAALQLNQPCHFGNAASAGHGHSVPASGHVGHGLPFNEWVWKPTVNTANWPYCHDRIIAHDAAGMPGLQTRISTAADVVTGRDQVIVLKDDSWPAATAVHAQASDDDTIGIHCIPTVVESMNEHVSKQVHNVMPTGGFLELPALDEWGALTDDSGALTDDSGSLTDDSRTLTDDSDCIPVVVQALDPLERPPGSWPESFAASVGGDSLPTVVEEASLLVPFGQVAPPAHTGCSLPLHLVQPAELRETVDANRPSAMASYCHFDSTDGAIPRTVAAESCDDGGIGGIAPVAWSSSAVITAADQGSIFPQQCTDLFGAATTDFSSWLTELGFLTLEGSTPASTQGKLATSFDLMEVITEDAQPTYSSMGPGLGFDQSRSWSGSGAAGSGIAATGPSRSQFEPPQGHATGRGRRGRKCTSQRSKSVRRGTAGGGKALECTETAWLQPAAVAALYASL